MTNLTLRDITERATAKVAATPKSLKRRDDDPASITERATTQPGEHEAAKEPSK